MKERAHRRVVTGLNKDGQSCVIVDGPLLGSTSRSGVTEFAWHTAAVPADNSARTDIAPMAMSVESLSDGGSRFFIQSFPPDHGGKPFWHATDTIDYITMLEGEVVFMTETGEVTLRPGDMMVDRGIRHAWRNDSGSPAVASIVIVPAHPVDAGGGEASR